MTPDRLAALHDEDLGRVIGSLDLRWPTTPDVTATVVRQIEHRPAPRHRPSRTTVVLLIAAAILVLAAAAGAARFVFRAGGIAIRSVPTPTALPASPVEPGVIGRAVSLVRAERALGEPLPIPGGLGQPDVVWLRSDVTSFEPLHHGVVIAMPWRPSAELPRIPGTPYGATLFAFRGDAIVAIKSVEGPVRELRSHGAAWIDAPHELDLLVDGRVRPFRVNGTVLVWQEDDLALRLETALGRRTVTDLAFAHGT